MRDTGSLRRLTLFPEINHRIPELSNGLFLTLRGDFRFLRKVTVRLRYGF